jgi:diaminohydroxyphosphoribosylaminopyrimidine deaminase/5-amino-6-(5-phosphoribosylamino)uracil reductase
MKGCGCIDIPDESSEDAVWRALLRLSIFASGRTSPNPSVACVISSKEHNILIGGATEPAGRRHAEIVALDALDRFALEHSRFDPPVPLTMTVTLEPCSRHGRTPPCVLRIAQYSRASDFSKRHGLYIDTVRIAEADPSMDGQGFAALIHMGFSVEHASGAFRSFLQPFFSRLRGRPLYTVKLATDRNGVMGHRKCQVSLTGLSGRILTMRLRAKCDGVLAGPGTVAVDRPSLDLRPPLLSEEVPFQESSMQRFDTEDARKVWFRSLFEPGCGWTAMEDPALQKEFQPLRIFLLGRPFDDVKLFFEKQEKLSIETGRQALFLSLRSMSHYWPGAIQLPDLNDPAFVQELSQCLAEHGLNRVLIESGYGLLPLWLSALNEDDLFLHVQNEDSMDTPGDGWLRVDTGFTELDRIDGYAFAPGLMAAACGRRHADGN